MENTHNAILDWLEKQVALGKPDGDVLDQDKAPGTSVAEAYRLQFALARRLVAKGDRLIGYKAAYTSKAMQVERGMPGPIIGSLLRSGLYAEDKPIALDPRIKTMVEPEIAVLLGRDLAGPGLSPAEALNAVEGVFPAMEIAGQHIDAPKRSMEMGIAVHKTSGGIVVGGPLVSARGIDLRLEGMVMSINGEVRGSACGVEVMGNPLDLVATIANVVGEHGETLKAGMVLMTGSIISALPVKAGDDVLIEFTRLGRVTARFSAT